METREDKGESDNKPTKNYGPPRTTKIGLSSGM